MLAELGLLFKRTKKDTVLEEIKVCGRNNDAKKTASNTTPVSKPTVGQSNSYMENSSISKDTMMKHSIGSSVSKEAVGQPKADKGNSSLCKDATNKIGTGSSFPN